VGEAEILARTGATAMMDLSDGLAIDLPRLCRASGVGARVALGDVPVAGALERGADALGLEALPLALSGGEDYELVATLPRDAVETARAGLFEAFGTRLSDVGEIVEGSGVDAVRDDGSTSPLEPAGWDHFGRG
jgi:thiamine-monophosphate kinase